MFVRPCGLPLSAPCNCEKCAAQREQWHERCVKEKDPTGRKSHEDGAKLDSGKPLAGLLGLFSRALLEVTKVSTHGAQKYSRGGWQNVPNGIERYEDAKWRHLLKGCIEENDPDSGLLHAAHEAWNALAKLELMLRDKEKSND